MYLLATLCKKRCNQISDYPSSIPESQLGPTGAHMECCLGIVIKHVKNLKFLVTVSTHGVTAALLPLPYTGYNDHRLISPIFHDLQGTKAGSSSHPGHMFLIMVGDL